MLCVFRCSPMLSYWKQNLFSWFANILPEISSVESEKGLELCLQQRRRVLIMPPLNLTRRHIARSDTWLWLESYITRAVLDLQFHDSHPTSFFSFSNISGIFCWKTKAGLSLLCTLPHMKHLKGKGHLAATYTNDWLLSSWAFCWRWNDHCCKLIGAIVLKGRSQLSTLHSRTNLALEGVECRIVVFFQL